MKNLVIVNPAARKGKSGDRWALVEAKLSQHGLIHDTAFTKAPKHASELARQAIQNGYQRILSVGGDGTLNEVLNGVLQDGKLLAPDLIIAPIPAGTANEICRATGLLAHEDAPYQAIAGGKTKNIDIQLVDCIGFDGAPYRLHASLATSFGSAALISYKTSQSRFIKKLSAELSYYIVALMVTLSYDPTKLRVEIDDEGAETRLVHSGLICNGRYVGGGIDMAPMAQLDDGICEMVEFGDFGRLDLITKPRSWLAEGHHIKDPKITVLPGHRFHIDGRNDIWVDCDGETVGQLPLTVQVFKQAVKMHVL